MMTPYCARPGLALIEECFTAGSYFVVMSALLWPTVAPAQASRDDYPSKPVRLICAFPPGGLNDYISRYLAPRIAAVVGQQVIVDNRSGAGGIIGTELGARAQPDGYTINFGSTAVLAINPALYKKLPYDSVRDFAPIIELAESVLLVAVHPSVQASTIPQLIALAKSKPGTLNFGSAGSGTPGHLAGELLNSMGGIALVHVPYKGSGGGIPALVAGEVQLYVLPIAASLTSLVRAGRLRALAVTATSRSPVMPEVPTVSESGLPGYEMTSWYGLLAPAATPRARVLKLNAVINDILASPEVTENLVGQGMLIKGGSPEAFAARIKSEMVKWGKVVRDTGAKAD
jgi:tripartite-type tricarboxylate transporter receptor subunit TctC